MLPGSRRQEISRILPVMLSVVGEQFADYQFIVGVAPAIPLSFYQQIAAQHSPATEVDFEVGRTYDLLSNAYAALVTSGTATLETALFKVPQVVCYRGSRLSYFIAKRLVSVRFISLVNLIADRLIVTELIQNQLNTKNLSAALRHILQKEVREKMQTDYDFLCQQLGEAGASERAAQQMVQLLEQPKT